MKLIIAFIIIFFIILSIQYSTINVQNTIYFDRNDKPIVVLKKNLFVITIAYMDKTPKNISIFDFILNYRENRII